MPPKVDKKQQSAALKAVEDRTFGLKNKNRSTKIQKFIQQQKSSVLGKQANSASAKEKKKQEEAERRELDMLFKVAVKKSKDDQKAAASEAEVVEEEPKTLEEWIDRERSRMTVKTPVTWDTFIEWKSRRTAARAEEAERRASSIRAGHTAGMSGRELLQSAARAFTTEEDADEGMDVNEIVAARKETDELYDISNLGKNLEEKRRVFEAAEEAKRSAAAAKAARAAASAAASVAGPSDGAEIEVDESLFDDAELEGLDDADADADAD